MNLRDFDLRDLLPRPSIHADGPTLRAVVEGRRVLVTGAGGSLGSELCRQIVRHDCASLIMFERHENALHEIALSVDHPAAHAVIGDMLDTPRLEEVFTRFRPELVFHAAAHKHLPLMEMELNAREAVKNNVTGTRVVAEAADRHGVAQFVLLSTDKAVHPSSVMGATKRVAELMMRDLARRSSTEFVSVRFGNVLGSSGSVVPRFLDQIRAGGPVTITHPDVRRFFLLIPEAVELVIAAAALGGSGAIYVLDMGTPVLIVELAKRLMHACGVPSLPIEFIGLRQGEKLDEELLAGDETSEPTPIAHISEIRGAKLAESFAADVELLEQLAVRGHVAEAITQLQMIVPSFTTQMANVATGFS